VLALGPISQRKVKDMKTYRCYALVAEVQAKDKEDARVQARDIIHRDIADLSKETAIIVKRQHKGE